MRKNILFSCNLVRYIFVFAMAAGIINAATETPARETISINAGWRFQKGDPNGVSNGLIYDVRPDVKNDKDDRAADAKPTEAEKIESEQAVLKPWILPTGNAFIKNPAKRYARPADKKTPADNCPYIHGVFDDSGWERVDLPHDWAIKGPFLQGWNTVIGGSMGRLPVHGVGWYRKKIDIAASDAGKSIFLDVDGAMSYAMVWLNGKLVGGWPFGYNSWRVDLTPYLVPGGENQLAIRLDNPPSSSRWYPGSGIYRNVWLVKTQPVHVAQWGTFVSTSRVTKSTATVALDVSIENDSDDSVSVRARTEFFALDSNGAKIGSPVASIEKADVVISPRSSTVIKDSTEISNPRLWGPPPNQAPHRYVAVTTLTDRNRIIDCYETRFGIREIRFDADKGVFVNGERIFIKGVNQHHDLGALGAAFNTRAAERQLEMLREMGCNAVRMAHNPPAPELLELTDKIGFLVIDEIYDDWERKKSPLDFHLIFPDWHEQDLRAMIRRDRNNPSVIAWSVGNEVGEQYTDHAGAVVAKRLYDIAKDEDPTRPVTASINYAKPHMPLPEVFDLVSLNYQGEGIRNAPAYAGLKGISTPPSFPAFHAKFPSKLIFSSENAATVSSRGDYIFPVDDGISAPAKDGQGGDPKTYQVSAYELYTAEFGASPDKVFAAEDQHPYVAGGFVWSGWDYLGEPTPYYLSRSSYFGIIDLAGFKKDRFYLYQSRWRPELPIAHILPHWSWPDRAGKVTPVHVFTSGDEAELFLNGESLGRKKKGQYEYRLRWDDVVYKPGKLEVVAYKNGQRWASGSVATAGSPAKIEAKADRAQIRADGNDLSFVTIRITDKTGNLAPRANNRVSFKLDGPGEIVATDNGDPTNMESFASHERAAFNDYCLLIIRSKVGTPGTIKISMTASGLQAVTVTVESVAYDK